MSNRLSSQPKRPTSSPARAAKPDTWQSKRLRTNIRRTRPYDRSVDLVRLLPLWPAEIADRSLEGHRRIVAMLKNALRAERQRGRAGHWTYDLARHLHLLEACRAEQQALLARQTIKLSGPHSLSVTTRANATGGSTPD